MPHSALGTVRRDREGVVLHYERALAHPPEKVWRAITESEHLHHWFPADIVGPREAGADLRFVFWPETVAAAGEEIEAAGLSLDGPVLAGRLLTWEPPHLLELTWDTEHLRFDLSPTDDGTRLTVTIRAPEPGPRGFQSNAAGYHTCLDALGAHLDGRSVSLFDEQRTAVLEQAYADLVRAVLGHEELHTP